MLISTGVWINYTKFIFLFQRIKMIENLVVVLN